MIKRMSGLWLRAAVMWLLTTLSGAAVLYGGGKAAWFIFGCLLFMSLLGTAGSLLMRGDIQIVREPVSRSLHAGDSLQVQVSVVLPFRYPLAFVMLHEQWMNEQTHRVEQGSVLLVPLGRRQLQFDYTIPNVTRGIYRLYRVETIAVDFLHLSGFRRRSDYMGQHEHEEDEVIVYPYVLPSLETELAQARQEHPVLLGGLREYVPGDSLRALDWKSYLRRGKLMTRLPDPDSDGRPIMLILDAGADDAQFERAVSAAAGWVSHVLRTACSDAVIQIVSGDQEEYRWPASSDEQALLRELACIRRRPDIPVASLLQVMQRQRSDHPCEYVLVTGRLDNRLARWVLAARNIGESRELAVLYAAEGAVLSRSEHRIQAELQRAGCMVDYVSSRPVDHGLQQGGWTVYG